jgi:hypothetical protein
MDIGGLLIEVSFDGAQLSTLDERALRKVFETTVIPRVMEALKQGQTASRDWSATASGGASSGGGWSAGGSVSYSWKGFSASRDGSVSIGGGASAGGNWNVNGNVTIRF